MRAKLETAPDKRPWNKAQVIFLCTMRDNAGLTKEKFDIRWVSTGIRVSVNSAHGLIMRGAPPSWWDHRWCFTCTCRTVAAMRRTTSNRDEWTEKARAHCERYYDDKMETPEVKAERVLYQRTRGDSLIALQGRRVRITVDRSAQGRCWKFLKR